MQKATRWHRSSCGTARRAPRVLLSQLEIFGLTLSCVVVQNDSLATLLARLEGVLGPVPRRLLRAGRFSHRFYTRAGALFERSARTVHPAQIALFAPRFPTRWMPIGESMGCLRYIGRLIWLPGFTRAIALQLRMGTQCKRLQCRCPFA